MRSNRFLIVMLLVLVHSFISCDGAAYHLQEDVDHIIAHFRKVAKLLMITTAPQQQKYMLTSIATVVIATTQITQ